MGLLSHAGTQWDIRAAQNSRRGPSLILTWGTYFNLLCCPLNLVDLSTFVYHLTCFHCKYSFLMGCIHVLLPLDHSAPPCAVLI